MMSLESGGGEKGSDVSRVRRRVEGLGMFLKSGGGEKVEDVSKVRCRKEGWGCL